MTLKEKNELSLRLQKARDAVLAEGWRHWKHADEHSCFRLCREHAPHLVEEHRKAYVAYMAA